jgi:hypothetical protein
MLDETVDAQPYLSVHVTAMPQPEKAIGFTEQAPHPTVSNLSIVYSANTMQSMPMKMCVSFYH